MTREPFPVPEGARALQRWAVALLVIVVLHVVASPVYAVLLPERERVLGRPEGLGLLLAAVAPTSWIAALADGTRVPGSPTAWVASYVALLVGATACWVGALRAVHRLGAITPVVVDRMVRWSAMFAVLMALATPVLVHDFWLSVAWGDEVVRGLNPYATGVAHPGNLGPLPLGPDMGQMTYGPLWALLSAGAIGLAGGQVVLGALFLKLLMAGCWIGTIVMARRLVSGRGPVAEAAAVVLLGWSPLALFQGVGDGHNDVVFVLPILLWLWWSQRDRPLPAAVALGASVAIKYVTAPLLGIHVLHGLQHRRASAWRWLTSAVVSVAIVVGCILVFYRSSDFFATTAGMRSWQFHTPAAAVATLVNMAGRDGDGLRGAVNLLLIAVAGLGGLHALRRRGGMPSALLWWMTGILLAVVGHVWPWFVLWLLPLAAIDQDSRLAWLGIGLALAAPFTLVVWVAFPEVSGFWRVDMPGVLLFAGAGAIALWRPLRVPTAAPGPAVRDDGGHTTRDW